MPEQPKRSESLASVIRRGDRAKSLRALANKLAAEIDVCDTPRDIASLSGRLADVLTQIEAIKAPMTSKRDELARKRAERQRKAAAGGADTADSGVAAGGDERGD